MRNLLRIHLSLDADTKPPLLAQTMANVIYLLGTQKVIPELLFLKSSSKAKAREKPIESTNRARVESSILEQLDTEDFPDFTIASFWGEYTQTDGFVVSSVFSSKMNWPHFLSLKLPCRLEASMVSVVSSLSEETDKVLMSAFRTEGKSCAELTMIEGNGAVVEGTLAQSEYEIVYKIEERHNRANRNKIGF